MIPVKFIKPTMPYLAGETAWFNEVNANLYIKQGFAELDKEAGEFVRAKTRTEVMAEEEQRNLVRMSQRVKAAGVGATA